MNSIAVVIPLFNKESYICRALDSVLAQSLSPDEIIVVNDGSNDNGAVIVRENYPQVKVIDQPNQGVSAARNAGINCTKAQFIAFLDADDYWLPNFLKNIVELKTKFPSGGMYFTHYAFLSEDSVTKAKLRLVPTDPGYVEDFFAACCNSDLPVTASSVCIKRDVLVDIGGFPVGIAMGEDQIVWARVACQSKVFYHPETSAYYDLSTENSACDVNKIYEPAPQLSVYNQLLKEGKVPNTMIDSLRVLMHFTVLSCVKNNLLVGNNLKARKLLLEHSSLFWDKYRFGALLISFMPNYIIRKIIGIIRRKR